MIYESKHINLFIGKKDNKTIILPYTFNQDSTKIKIITDGTILEVPEVKSELFHVVEKQYNSRIYDLYNLSTLVPYKTVTDDEMDKLLVSLIKLYDKELGIIYDEDNSNEEYKNF